MQPRHTDGSNLLYCDGHVKWFRPNAVSYGPNAQRSTDPQATDNANLGNRSAAGTAYSGTPSYAATFSVN